MSESIAEMVIPGTYIEVRAEGLIGVGRHRHRQHRHRRHRRPRPGRRVVALGSLAEAVDVFGAARPVRHPASDRQPA